VPDASVFPPGVPSRDAFVTLQTEFPPGETSPIVVLADVSGDPTSPDNVRALAEYAAGLDGLEGIDRVESPFSGVDPATGQPYTADQIAQAYSLPNRPPELEAALAAYVRGSTVRFDAISPLPPAQPEATGLIPVVRDLDAAPGITTQVGGAAAGGYDFLAGMTERIPIMLVTVIGAMLVVLFLLFGSVVLPVKAVFMTLLSLTASFGALVWIFQDGNLEGLLNFESPGYTVAGNPVIMFAVLFGLSMDYEVLLLSRIQEAWRRTGDNTEAVGEGLAKTAGVITGAALIMVVVFGAFALADTITIKSIGVGMALAVAIDATIIRVLLVPATMRLLGRWNWWAPGPLGRLADRLGFSHASDPPRAGRLAGGTPGY
jgi:RND superfamily putative drug exporter